MNQNEQEEIIDSPIDTEETENDEQEHDENPDEQEDNEKEELKKKLATLEAQKDHWRKKASESKVKEVKKDSSLGTKDMYALIQAGVHEDDIDDVTEYATFKKISIGEALKSSVVKATLSEKSEFRKTAEMSNTSNARKGTTKQSDSVLLDNFRKGNIPDSKEDAERLFWARNGGKR